MSDENTSIKHSALWAAYGDALGFMTELADSNTLKWRVGTPRVTQTVSWRRLIGGRFGVEAKLPVGCYSDDTQLRLATSRAIRGDGRFDVEAFAKVELPVWLAYALGAGKGTKLAAASLRSQDVAWFSNFFDKTKVRYIDCGGNGAAMRIQPHVWAAAHRSKPESYLLDVIRNSLCTHGHLRGIFGPVFHAVCLATTLEAGTVAGPDVWKDAVSWFSRVIPLIREDSNLGAIWLSVWQKQTGLSIEAATEEVMKECLEDIDLAIRSINERSDSSYCRLVEALGGLTNEQRGSGTKTAIIASALSWIHRSDYPATALVKAANLLGSDTDSIGTMAGAISGSISSERPKESILDDGYIEYEALRMLSLHRRNVTDSFPYPDLFTWQAPKTLLDAVGLSDGKLALAGLGAVEEVEPPLQSSKNDDAVWQWLRLQFGQTVFTKRREKPRDLSINNLPRRPSVEAKANTLPTGLGERSPRTFSESVKGPLQPSFLDNGKPRVPQQELQILSIDQLTTDVIKSGFDERLIGKHLLRLAQAPDGIELALAYVSIIVKARKARVHMAQRDKA